MSRNYKKEYANYHAQPEQIANRSKRNQARRIAMQAGLVRKGDGKDVDHKIPLSKGGSNARSNLRITPASANRSFPRTKSARMR